ncbi:MAG: radical SAM protein [Candidatus Nanohaloarchaea archaeon]
MTDESILLFSPAVDEDSFMPMINAGLGAVGGWLKKEGYDFDQKSMMAECRYRNHYRFRKDAVDLSVFERERVISYLRGNDDPEISRESRKMAEILKIDEYDILLVSSKSDGALMTALPLLREHAEDKLVVIGGSHTLTNELDIVRLPFIDYGVRGDGEIPISAILEHELDGEPLDAPGIVRMEGGELKRNEPYKHPLNMKPAPYYEQEILEKIKDISYYDRALIPYQFGDGCTQDCSFCNYFENQKYQYKDIEKVISELEGLKAETGSNAVFFTDSNLFNDPNYVERFAESIEKRGLDIDWGSQAIILARRQEFFDKLAESGFKTLFHGIESASDTVLHRMHKAESRRMIEETLEKESNAGIKPFGFFITDFVNETMEEYYETVDFFREQTDLVGAGIYRLEIYKDENMPLYSDSGSFDIELIENDYRDFIERSLPVPLDFREKGKPRNDSLGKSKLQDMQKKADYHLFLKNFGTKNPSKFLRKMLHKTYKKDYRDYSWLYA